MELKIAELNIQISILPVEHHLSITAQIDQDREIFFPPGLANNDILLKNQEVAGIKGRVENSIRAFISAAEN